MKKFKKIFSVLACVTIALVSSFTLTACSKEEIAENTETVIDTTTSILTVEYSQALKDTPLTQVQHVIALCSFESKFNL